MRLSTLRGCVRLRNSCRLACGAGIVWIVGSEAVPLTLDENVGRTHIGPDAHIHPMPALVIQSQQPGCRHFATIPGSASIQGGIGVLLINDARSIEVGYHDVSFQLSIATYMQACRQGIEN